MEEMDYRFYRSGYSTIVRESRDFSCVVTDRQGRLAVSPPMFFHGPVYYHLIQRILELYGEAGLADGDTLVCNHPYEGNLPHLPDMALVTPVFCDGALVAFTASIAHKADMGGAVPGSTWGQATELFQEGLLLPPVKIARDGKINADMERLIASNSRAPELVLGDMNAQIGITGIGRKRLAKTSAPILSSPPWMLLLKRRIAAFEPQFPASPMANIARKAFSIMTVSIRTSRCACMSGYPSMTETCISISRDAPRKRGVRQTCASRWSRPVCSIASSGFSTRTSLTAMPPASW
jgi:hypothetical protein